MRRNDVPAGSGVSVQPRDGTSGAFDGVTVDGHAGVVTLSNPTATLPFNFQLTTKLYADVITDAVYTGQITTCLSYPDANGDGLVDGTSPQLPDIDVRILHAEDGTFVDRTVSNDLVHHVVCAATSSLSEFAVGAAPSTTTTTTLPGVTCSAAPSSCQPAMSRRSSVTVVKGSSDARDKLGWKWTSSGPVATGDFGAPSLSSDYALCVYDATGLVMAAAAPAGGTCGSVPCWKATATGDKYASKGLTPDGLKSIVLKSGTSGKAKIAIKSKGSNLHVLSLPFASGVRVQLVRSDTGACWESAFSNPLVDTATRFKAKSD